MPAAPRTHKKCTKIAYKIMGTPANIRSEEEESTKEKKVNKRLIFEETSRMK